jgi:4-amino-4-deoxy-L-arabinose transferase-like glycosyltransferase
MDTQTPEKYIGHYQFNPTFDFYIVKEGDKLYGQAGPDKKELVPSGTDQFFAKDLDATIIFQVDANGKVTGLTKIQNNEMNAKRGE